MGSFVGFAFEPGPRYGYRCVRTSQALLRFLTGSAKKNQPAPPNHIDGSSRHHPAFFSLQKMCQDRGHGIAAQNGLKRWGARHTLPFQLTLTFDLEPSFPANDKLSVPGISALCIPPLHGHCHLVLTQLVDQIPHQVPAVRKFNLQLNTDVKHLTIVMEATTK